MKLRKLFLGVAIVALMAACGGKTETTTETAAEAPVVETPAEEATEAPAEEPVAEVKNETKPAAKQEDPCEAKVKKFEQFVDKLQAAQKNKANGAAALKEFAALVKEADAEQAAVKECINNVDYKSRVQNAMMRCKTSLK
ncbi:MAG: hypothetical protein J6R06_04775 [Bacteroidales bacterium]|jgi:hypothetical protein|nr:hypothetical protein [Bacteroidales bacterium]MBO7180140.1 hypothetical protein [Bacteroidales bacterium]MBO7229375.1 hypothetical protein [Bacteroidales bacterium]MBQ1192225.1 hypothetical protein [Bacteroidales bacterium]MBQ2303794.1 hypothetical protein [Bacteroidales bacterium]